MASKTTITITHDKESTVDLKNRFQITTQNVRRQCEVLMKLFQELAMGRRMGSMVLRVDDGDQAAASGTVTFSALANNDTVTVGDQVFTAKTSGAAGNNQFNLGANDTDAATNFAAAVNAHPNFVDVVSASPAAAITTITAVTKGFIGNCIGIAISAHGSVSGAKLTGGTNSANITTNSGYKFGT